MAIENRKLGGKNPRLTIDLNQMFGQRVPGSSAFREAVGQAILDAIKKQAGEGRNRKGSKYSGRPARYSKQYKMSDEFKAAGKGSNVNMRLTGDMLELMDVISTSRTTITIGWDERDEAAKAHGHILGSDPGPKVRRDFFGLPDSEYKKIAGGFSLPTNEPSEGEAGLLSSLVTLRALFSG